MLDKENKLEQEAVDSRVYEVGYLLVPTIPADDVSGVYSSMKDVIATLGGEIISDEMPKNIELAYAMDKVIQNKRYKFTEGYFGWFKFFMDASQVAELKKKMDLDTNVIRFLIVKTVKENTLSQKKFTRVEGPRKKTTKKEDGDTEQEEIITEELDKEIEAMVTEA